MGTPAARPRVLSLTQPADFQRTLARVSTARTPHFAVHHLSDRPLKRQLSTGPNPDAGSPVDETVAPALWLGLVVPKRHAKRSVTRSLIKRQMRAAVQRCTGLHKGIWVLRLRQGFDRTQFPSATSLPLARTVRAELDQLLSRAGTRRPAAGEAG